MPAKEFAQPVLGEATRVDLRNGGVPPVRWGFAVVKTNAAKLPRITEDERAFSLREAKVVVLPKAKTGRLRPQCSAHSEMNAEPGISRKDEEHLLSLGLGSQQFLADKAALQRTGVHPAKNALLAMQLDAQNRAAEAWIPASAKIFHLTQLWHGRRLDRPLAPCYSWPEWKK
jgi:hypothetical protein